MVKPAGGSSFTPAEMRIQKPTGAGEIRIIGKQVKVLYELVTVIGWSGP